MQDFRFLEHPDVGCMVQTGWPCAMSDMPEAWCIRCEGELFGAEAEPDEWGHVLCPTCRALLEEPDDDGGD